MRSAVRDFIPSMFQRRLWLLIVAALAVCFVMLTQITRLTLVQGAAMRVESEGALSEWSLIPTIRGRILDAKGRVLAEDRPSDDIAVNYRVITGEWAYLMAKRAARAADVTRFVEMSYEEREKLIASYQPAYDAQAETLWKTLCEMGHIKREELERRKGQVKERVQQISSHLMLARWSAEQRRREEARRNAGGGVQAWLPDWLTERSMELADADESDQVEEIREEQASHPLLQNVDNVALIRAKRLIAAADGVTPPGVWSQVSVIASKVRAYPLETVKDLEIDRSSLPTPLASDRPAVVIVEGLGLHALGTLRDVWQEDVKARPFNAERDGPMDLGGYLAGDLTGAWGVERSREAVLRGSRGRQTRYLDTKAHQTIEPIPGRSVTMTLDMGLQARVQAIMEPSFGLMKVQPWHSKDPEASEEKPNKPSLGEALNGAAVVLDIETGDVLAMVSTPGISLRQLRENLDSVFDPRNSPFTNRAVARGFQPGSTVKPVVLNAAVADKKLAPGEEITCNGHYYERDTQHFRCWIYKSFGGRTHGPLTAPQAIMRSCNIFFNTLGDRLGADRLVWWYGQFGLGQPTGCGLDEEIGGSLPDYMRAHRGGRPVVEPSDPINMGIGQGPILWTPIQAANAYATIARGGILIQPHVVKPAAPADTPATDIHLNPQGVSLALGGLFAAVNEREGTANHLSLLGGEMIFKDLPNLRIYGKSGTADAAPLRIDSDHDGQITGKDQIVRQGDHAWCIVMLQRPGDARPRYVVAVVVEFGGSGGAVAGPVVSQVIRAMRREGYL